MMTTENKPTERFVLPFFDSFNLQFKSLHKPADGFIVKFNRTTSHGDILSSGFHVGKLIFGQFNNTFLTKYGTLSSSVTSHGNSLFTYGPTTSDPALKIALTAGHNSVETLPFLLPWELPGWHSGLSAFFSRPSVAITTGVRAAFDSKQNPSQAISPPLLDVTLATGFNGLALGGGLVFDSGSKRFLRKDVGVEFTDGVFTTSIMSSRQFQVLNFSSVLLHNEATTLSAGAIVDFAPHFSEPKPLSVSLSTLEDVEPTSWTGSASVSAHYHPDPLGLLSIKATTNRELVVRAERRFEDLQMSMAVQVGSKLAFGSSSAPVVVAPSWGVTLNFGDCLTA